MNTNHDTANQLAELKKQASEHVRDFYDAAWDTELKACLPDRFRILVEAARPLLDRMSLDELADELAATDAFRKGGRDFDEYITEEIRILSMIRDLFREANQTRDLLGEAEAIGRDDRLDDIGA